MQYVHLAHNVLKRNPNEVDGRMSRIILVHMSPNDNQRYTRHMSMHIAKVLKFPNLNVYLIVRQTKLISI